MTALAQALPRPKDRTARLAYDAALVVLGSLVVAGLAQIEIHLGFSPVPITGQTLGVILVGATLGSMRGGLSLGLYLAEGAIGLPFFSGGESGTDFLVLSAPTGGYLWGFVVAAFVVGFLAERGWDRSLGSSIGAMLIAEVIVFAAGIAWLIQAIDIPLFTAEPCNLSTLAGCDGLELGLYPFILGDLIKLGIAAGLLPAAWRMIRGKR